MAHPFEKLFDTALRKSTPDNNLVTIKARELIAKGYAPAEVCDVLTKLAGSLIAPYDESRVRESITDVCEEYDV